MTLPTRNGMGGIPAIRDVGGNMLTNENGYKFRRDEHFMMNISENSIWRHSMSSCIDSCSSSV